MDKLFKLTIMTSILLSGCIRMHPSACYENDDKKWAVCDKENNYTFNYPRWIEEDPKDNDVIVIDKSECPSLGVLPEDRKLISKSSYWGKVALLNAYDRDYDAVCQAYAPNCSDRDIFEGTCVTESATYAFCAEKDGKAVAICIQQMTDDEDMAREIFESFRWTN